MRAVSLVALATLLAACGGGHDRSATATATTRSPGTARSARASTDPWTHLRALAAVGRRNHGTRAAGTPGGVATERLIARSLRAAGWRVRPQRVTFPFFRERRAPLVALADGTRLRPGADIRTLTYSPGGAARATVQVVGGDRPDAGCRAADWGAFARGRIALARRGVCPFATKARNAQRAGAAALVVDDRAATGPGGPGRGTLGAPGLRIPVIAADADAGARLARAAGPVRLRVDAVSARRAAHDVIAELPGTDGRRVVMAGAHLDSVPEGPGVNDDGSGVAALLALASRLASAPRPRDTVRLGFWTAEELGLYGSRAYVAGLGAAERRRLRAYVNLDMVASPNAVLETYGAGAVEVALRRALDARGPRPQHTSIGGASDHASFARAGVPVAGVFTGASERVRPEQAQRFGARAGRPADPCYHRACDTLANANRPMLERVTAAVQDALRRLSS
jgi:peptidase M28-like protein/PA domain-containing protein